MQVFWLLIGGAAFILGAIGIPLPGWPTTIFWIIAAFCFANSRPEWRDWIYSRPGIGGVIEDFNERGVLSTTSKSAALIGMLGGGAIASWFFWGVWHWFALTWLLIAVGALIVVTRPAG